MNDIARDVIKGAIAGVAATWVMGRVTSWLYEHESVAARHREDNARQGKTAYGVAVEKGARLFGRELDDETRAKAGSRLHWVLGAGAGIDYALARRYVPPLGAGHGLLFGALFFLTVDELMNTALGFTPGPRAFPWQAHARGLAGHLVYGLAADTALSALDRVA